MGVNGHGGQPASKHPSPCRMRRPGWARLEGRGGEGGRVSTTGRGRRLWRCYPTPPGATPTASKVHCCTAEARRACEVDAAAHLLHPDLQSRRGVNILRATKPHYRCDPAVASRSARYMGGGMVPQVKVVSKPCGRKRVVGSEVCRYGSYGDGSVERLPNIAEQELGGLSKSRWILFFDTSINRGIRSDRQGS